MKANAMSQRDDDLVTLVQAGPRRQGELLPPPPPGFVPSPARTTPRPPPLKSRTVLVDLRPVVTCPCCHRDSYVEINQRGVRLARHPRSRLLSSAY